MYMRTVFYSGLVVTMINGQIYSGTTSITTGKAGISQHDVPSGNGFGTVTIYTRSHDVPATVQTNTIGTSSFPDKVDFHWTEPTDTTGVGITQHYIVRTDPSNPTGTLFFGFDGGNFTDATAAPSTNYQYAIGAISFHGIFGSGAYFPVVTPGPGSIDPRRVGIRPTGAYWGSMGENLDVLSGNLNFTIPLLKAQGRKDSTLSVGLSYNSQIWRHDNGGDWMLGQDVGYGLGWRLSLGSITPFWNGAYYTRIDHYTYTDATGAEYRLYQDPSNNGVYVSKESIYVTFDSNTNRLWFNNGTFWAMNCISGGTESDFGTMCPTLVQDSNGNQVVLQYKPGAGTDWANSSARIDWIQDVRTPTAGHHTLEFSYGRQDAGLEAIQHLDTIRNYINTGENYNFYTLINRAVTSPFTQQQFPITTVLQAVVVDGYGSHTAPAYNFLHDYKTEELTSVALPTGGSLGWDYIGYTFNFNRQMREVSTRYLLPNADGSGRLTYPIGRATDPVDGSLTVHSWFTVRDPSGGGNIATDPMKVFFFQTSGDAAMIGTVGNVQSRTSQNGDALSQDFFTWVYDTAGNPYIYKKQTLLDGGKPYQQNSYVSNERNQYGANIRTTIFDYTNSATPIRIYETSHVTDPGYANGPEYIGRYIRDRAVNVTVKNHSTNEAGLQLSHADYDGTNTCDATGQPAVTETMHDSAYSNGRKGNKTSESTPAGSSCWMYDILGNVYKTAGPGVPLTTITTNSNSNFSVPGQIQIDGDAASRSTFQFNAWLGVTNVNAPNNSNSGLSYDLFGRPSTYLSPLGVATNYYYYPDPNPNGGFFPPSIYNGSRSGQIAIVANRHWTRTTLDGLGRTIRVESGIRNTPDSAGDYSNALSVVDTQYGPCACSPMGKVTAVSQPYKPGDPVYWTTYAYDAIGRTTAVTAPDGSKAITAYQGNTTTVTDPAGKWKSTTRDVQGNAVVVTEPDPNGQRSSSLCDSRQLPPIAGGSGTLQTCYTYDTVEHLTTVTMPRSTATQTRTFNYDPSTLMLASEVQPETGLSCYFYTADSAGRGHNLLQKVIAKGNAPGASCTDGSGKATQYTYDAYSRVTQISRTPEYSPEDICQRANYYYDYVGDFPNGNAWGRLAQSSTGDASCTVIPSQNGSASQQRQFVEEFSYNYIGQLATKRLIEVSRLNNTQQSLRSWDVTMNYSEPEALLGSIKYPDTRDATGQTIVQIGSTVSYKHDLMGRQTMMEYDAPNSNFSSLKVTGATYNAANQFTSASWIFNGVQPGGQVRTYNALNQLTSISSGSPASNSPVFIYQHPSGSNNGQISLMADYTNGQTTTYNYDSLKRLAFASAVANGTSAWNQAYSYDGFGNLTAKTGSSPQVLNVDASTNRLGLKDPLFRGSATISTAI